MRPTLLMQMNAEARSAAALPKATVLLLTRYSMSLDHHPPAVRGEGSEIWRSEFLRNLPDLRFVPDRVGKGPIQH